MNKLLVLLSNLLLSVSLTFTMIVPTASIPVSAKENSEVNAEGLEKSSFPFVQAPYALSAENGDGNDAADLPAPDTAESLADDQEGESEEDEFKPDSGINAGFTGEGAGFTETGSQTIVTDEDQTITFTQNKNGTKTASILGKKGQVLSATISIPESSIQEGKAAINLGTNEGKQLLLTGNETSKETAPKLTINLQTDDMAAKVILSIDKETLSPGTVALIQAENGDFKAAPATAYNGDEGTLSVPITGSQKVIIVNNAIPFRDENDIPDYAVEAAAYVSARELMTGMGDTLPKPFDFDGLTSRGQFVTILYRLQGEPKVDGEYPEGIDPDAWYADAARWAVDNRLMARGGSGFDPQTDIARDQIMGILYRMNGSPEVSLSVLNRYTDTGSISNFEFKQAMAWGISKGLIGQGITSLKAQSKASRAEIAAMMERMIQNLY